MPQVDFDRKNFNRCLCGGCPVNRASRCVAGQEIILEEQGQIEDIQKESRMPDPKRMPGIYCAVGKSACSDLSERKMCLCPACSVAINGDLKNSYYCLRGAAEEVG